jgi:actin-related protein 8
MLSIVLCDLGFSTAVIHQEALAAAFGNGLSTSCVVNIGAQVTQVVCVEDGVALPHTALALPYGGDVCPKLYCLTYTTNLSYFG